MKKYKINWIYIILTTLIVLLTLLVYFYSNNSPTSSKERNYKNQPYATGSLSGEDDPSDCEAIALQKLERGFLNRIEKDGADLFIEEASIEFAQLDQEIDPEIFRMLLHIVKDSDGVDFLASFAATGYYDISNMSCSNS